jgi:SAM-dependent methyltransferase
MRGYAEDLAYIHDAGFTDFARRSGEFIVTILPAPPARVVDLGCGSGVFAARLVEAGHDVVGVDQSAAMLALARRRAPGAQFRRGAVWEAALPSCDAVTALGEVFNYRFEDVGERALIRLFARVYGALRPGGIFVFDLALVGRLGARMPRRSFTLGEDWACLVERELRRAGRMLTRRITSFRQVGTRYRRSDELHRLWLYRKPEVAAALRRVGFRVRILGGYGGVRFDAGLAAFVARK